MDLVTKFEVVLCRKLSVWSITFEPRKVFCNDTVVVRLLYYVTVNNVNHYCPPRVMLRRDTWPEG